MTVKDPEPDRELNERLRELDRIRAEAQKAVEFARQAHFPERRGRDRRTAGRAHAPDRRRGIDRRR